MKTLLLLLSDQDSTSNGFLILAIALVAVYLSQRVFQGDEEKDKKNVSFGCLVYAIIIGVILYGAALLMM